MYQVARENTIQKYIPHKRSGSVDIGRKEKVKYEVDPFNGLIFTKAAEKSKAPGFRHVVDGTFKINKDSTLTCIVKSPRPPINLSATETVRKLIIG